MAPAGLAVPQHPLYTRRDLIQAGMSGVLGLSLADVAALRGRAAAAGSKPPPPKAVIFIFLTGGPSQHDTFDMKPDAPAEIRGEFQPIATRTPGIHICEHLPLLARRSPQWALVRSLTHAHNAHPLGTMVMLTGRSELPPGFQSGKPQSTDWPAIAAVAGYATRPRNNLPRSAVLPEKIILPGQGTFPGQFAGLLGQRHDPWFIDAAPQRHHDHAYSGAYPGYTFNLHKGERSDRDNFPYQAPHLALPEGVFAGRFRHRLALLREIERQRRELEQSAEGGGFDRSRRGLVSLLADSKVQRAFDVTRADPKTQERYGANSFGWSLLMARRLVEAGVNLVQVNLGNMGTWDLHGNNFPLLKDFLFPPTDRAVSALLDDLQESGLLESTLVVLAGEFGRTPKLSLLSPPYKTVGRDHWGPLQSVLFAGGVRGGTVVGSSDKIGAYPASELQTPENFAATIYQALGIPQDAHWYDATGRPFPVYHAEPIKGLFV
jgi:uncharacterized protein (DUF1501 family)